MANSALTLASAVMVGCRLPAVAAWGGDIGMLICLKVQIQSKRKGELNVPRRVGPKQNHIATANGRGEAEDQEAPQRAKATGDLFVTTEIIRNYRLATDPANDE